MIANVALARLTSHAKVFKGNHPNHGVDASSSGMVAAGEFSSRYSNILTPDFIDFTSKSMLDRCASANAAVEDLVTFLAASPRPEYNAKISGGAGNNGGTVGAGDTSDGMVTGGSAGTGGGAGMGTGGTAAGSRGDDGNGHGDAHWVASQSTLCPPAAFVSTVTTQSPSGASLRRTNSCMTWSIR
jgi:hypothetical protein